MQHDDLDYELKHYTATSESKLRICGVVHEAFDYKIKNNSRPLLPVLDKLVLCATEDELWKY